MEPSLIVLAAGIGSRYGSLKQIDQFGPNGESIIDYSIYDALQVGFKKIVIVIREDIKNEFEEEFRRKLTTQVEVSFVIQNINQLPPGFSVPEGRQKPWGTAHAVLSAQSEIKEPFTIVNADDFYGRSSFQVIYKFLKQVDPKSLSACLVGFILKNTLSKFGGVSRGICKIDQEGFLKEIVERTQIVYLDGAIYFDQDGKKTILTGNEIASMNLIGFTPDIFPLMNEQFVHFLNEQSHSETAEFYIPIVLDKILEGGIKVPVLPTDEQWFGVTYKEDKTVVRERLQKLIEDGVYPENLW